ncbi:MAG: hypothetical protein PWR30_470 [Candidatus Woesearchaeota archaeon]|nr:hypothetical protein [Candidatus Woesearchaeota archaeon]
MTEGSLKKGIEENKRNLSLFSVKKQIEELFYEINKKDIALILILPIISVLIMFLPLWIRETLVVNIENPSWWQYITIYFVHGGLEHLFSNLIWYFVFSFLGLIISNSCDEKKKYFILFFIIVLTFPLFGSFIQFLGRRSLYSVGSSGIVSALVGLTIVFWIYYFNRKNRKINFDLKTLFAFVFYICSFFLYIYIPKKIYSITSFIIFLFFLFLLRQDIKNIFLEIKKEAKENLPRATSLIISIFFFVLIFIIIFPSNIINNEGAIIDYMMHFAGISYGFVISYIVLYIQNSWVKIIKQKAKKISF